jgi:hypothetical protein
MSFLWQDALCCALGSPDSGPYRVITHNDMTFQPSMHDRSITLSAGRIKPAYMLDKANYENVTTSSLSAWSPRAAIKADSTCQLLGLEALTIMSTSNLAMSPPQPSQVGSGGLCGNFSTVTPTSNDLFKGIKTSATVAA